MNQKLLKKALATAFILFLNLACHAQAFITTWRATDGSITIPTNTSEYTYNYSVYWENKSDASDNGTLTGQTGNATITGLTNNTDYSIEIDGNFPHFYMAYGSERLKLKSVDQWGDIEWKSMAKAFRGCSNLIYTATDNPNLSAVTDLSEMFLGASNFNGNINSWNTGNVTDMSGMFADAVAFNQSINNWNTENVTDMLGMFSYATSFNQSLNNWDTKSVMDMSNMFASATSFNQTIGNWNAASVMNMSEMFDNAASFNQSIDNWNTQNVTDMSRMFHEASSFNQNLNNWDTKNVTNMSEMFREASSFNQRIDNWDTRNVEDMSGMFFQAISFDQDLGKWDLSNSPDMDGMLEDTRMSTQNYDASLIGWARLDAGETAIPTNVSLDADGVKYCLAASQRALLINTYDWDINGDSRNCLGINTFFVTTWQTIDGSITIPTNTSEYTYNYSVYWENKSDASDNGILTGQTGNATITGLTNNTDYSIEIDGNFPHFYMAYGSERLKLKSVDQWGDIEWKSMAKAFRGCSNLIYTATDNPNLSAVTDLSEMFLGASNFNGNINSWNTGNVTDMSGMFADAVAFNQSINNWNTENVTDMLGMFSYATSFNQSLNNWDTKSVMDMSNMFASATSFNQTIGNWNTASVMNMSEMFDDAASFNQSIDNWNTQNVTDMSRMFHEASSFNQRIDNWDTKNVTNMSEMFREASSFNQRIDNWDTRNVEDMSGMFFQAISFDQDLGKWDLSNSPDMDGMLEDTRMSTQNYDASLMGWARLDAGETAIPTNVSLDADGINYCRAATERDLLINTYDWDINGDSEGCQPFITTWQTIDGSITIPTNTSEYTYNYSVYWENKSDASDNGTLTGQIGNATITGLTNNTDYSIEISGDFPHFYMNNRSSEIRKLRSIDQWGSIEWKSMKKAFFGCSNLAYTAIDNPDLSAVTDLSEMFKWTSNFNGNINGWDTGNITNMSGMFVSAISFNQSLDNWNTQNVEDMSEMFEYAIPFNQSIGNWNTQNVTDMSGMFYGASSFNQSLDNWDTRNVADMSAMFIYASSFNENLNSWNTQNVIDMSGMFYGASSFNQSLDNWNTSSVTDMSGMFYEASSFNQSLDNWNTQNVTDMSDMFFEASSFNQSLDNWNTSSVTNMESLFSEASSFNGEIGSWNTSRVTNMSFMFFATATATFNQDISDWNTANVTNMFGMFAGAVAFNQDISSWNTANVTNMLGMFAGAVNFNQDISSWNTANVTDMFVMFLSASSFNQNLGDWDISKVTTAEMMLDGTNLSISNYDATLEGWARLDAGETAIPTGVLFGADGLSYCSSEAARTLLDNTYSWSISGDSKNCTNTVWNGSSWSNGVPNSSMEAIINGSYASTSFSASQLTVNAPYLLRIAKDDSVMVSGDLVNNGTIIVEHDGSLIQTKVSPDNSGTGTYTLERTAPNYKAHYNYWSSPVMNATIDDVFGTTGTRFYTFDVANQAWAGADKHTDLPAGLGFIATGTSSTPGTITRTFTSTDGFHSGEYTQPVIFDGTPDPDQNWHLVGNPYPSGLDVTQFIADNTSLIEGAVYLWSSDGSDYNSSAADYATMNALGIVNVGGSGVAPSSATISSGQGFFVQSKAAGSLTFSNSQRVAANNTFLRTNSDDAKVWIGVENQNGVSNEILIGFKADAMQGKDSYDANKFSGNNLVSLYSIGDFKSGEHKLAIQGLPSLTNDRTVPIGIEAKEAGEFVFSLNHLEGIDELTEVYLYDYLTAEMVNLRKGNYKVNLEEGEFNDRFELRFVGGKVTSLPEELADLGIELYSSNQSVIVQFTDKNTKPSQISLYDVSGRQIGLYHNQGKQEIRIPVSQTGIYIVRVGNTGGFISRKVFID